MFFFVDLGPTFIFLYSKTRMPAYPARAPNTNKMQANIQHVNAVSPFDLSNWSVKLAKMLVRTKNNVMSRAILPGTISGGIRKLVWKHKNKKKESFNKIYKLV